MAFDLAGCDALVETGVATTTTTAAAAAVVAVAAGGLAMTGLGLEAVGIVKVNVWPT